MLEKSLCILFRLKKPKNYRTGPVPIYLRITVDGDEKEVSAKREWLPSRWSTGSHRASGTKEDARTLNEYLYLLQAQAYEARKQLIESGKVITATAIKDLLTGAEKRKRNLLALFTSHNNDLEKMIGKGFAKGTSTNFNTSFKHTEAFLKSQYKVSDINILSLDLEFAKRFYNWLRTEKNLNHNSALKNMANMKKVVIGCVDNGWLPLDPFIKFDMTRDEVETVHLVKKDIQALANKRIDNIRLNRVRDIFLFSCFTGLSFVDMKKLKRSEIKFDNNGHLRIFKGRQKTGTYAQIPLLPIANSILKKYENDEDCIAQDLLLPVLSNQKYNAYLKELGDICGIAIPLSTKIGRNTFGTSVTLANNVPLESISKMMGHKSLRQTQHYAKVVGTKLKADMNTLSKKISRTNFISTDEIIRKRS